ncbi:uncharacterized protein LOC116350602 [Contarinia nasturtii]|uniref:uncharacterized protein LOC116350602 n=1 Tax=Contarinia nasturtii TaxID=265458 RepID=UPI0012D3EE07|nr:uncharacterized protein LOC116350602 [Contarinia nasturtii]
MIAMKAAQQTLKEGQLEYGFKKRPIEVPRRRVIPPNVPEERLYDMNAKVIEFKKPSFSAESEFDDEPEFESDEDDPMVNEHEKEHRAPNPNHFYYSDIGFSELNRNDQKFKNIPISTTPGPQPLPPNPYYMGHVANLSPEQIYLQQLWDAYERSYKYQHQCPAYQTSLTRRR